MIKTVILDVDGILTDGKKHYDENGKVIFKIFCDKDWTAIKRFRAIGINIIFITGDPFNEAIIQNRNLPVIVCRRSGTHNDKSHYLTTICTDYQCTPAEICFVGDDIFDIQLMRSVRHAFCPLDSPAIVQDNADILSCVGGDNVIMVLFDTLEQYGLIPTVPFEEIIDKIYALDVAEKF